MDKRYMALNTSMLVLRLLEQRSMYGYQIIRELEQQSQMVFRLQEGTLYPVLHGLEQLGARDLFLVKHELLYRGKPFKKQRKMAGCGSTMRSLPAEKGCCRRRQRNGELMRQRSIR